MNHFSVGLSLALPRFGAFALVAGGAGLKTDVDPDVVGAGVG
jgi:hypothetical protein